MKNQPPAPLVATAIPKTPGQKIPEPRSKLANLIWSTLSQLLLHPNGEGRRYVSHELLGWQLQDQRFRDALFRQRAIAVRMALHRWHLAKGTLPDTLEELVPHWLPAVPADSYDGRPLRWVSSGGGFLYSAGSAWKDDPANAFPVTDKDLGFMNQNGTTPALRPELPATKAPAKAN